jgi:beta-N-acetylhexosaminidase
MNLLIDIPLGTSIEEYEKVLINPQVLGVILFAHQDMGPLELSHYCAKLKKVNPQLIIFADQEGGQVQRMKKGFTPLPPFKILGDCYDKDPALALSLAHNLALVMAYELKVSGVDHSLAPLLDLHGSETVIAGMERAISADIATLIAVASVWIDGMNSLGMVATGKHFPGHGRLELENPDESDSHTAKLIDKQDRTSLNQLMLPFKALHERLAAVMLSHVVYKAVDEANVVCHSEAWRDIIEEQCPGALRMSDCLSMKGVDFGNESQESMLKRTGEFCEVVIFTHHDLSSSDLLQLLQKLPLATVEERSEIRKKFAAMPISENADQQYKEASAAMYETVDKIFSDPEWSAIKDMYQTSLKDVIEYRNTQD